MVKPRLLITAIFLLSALLLGATAGLWLCGSVRTVPLAEPFGITGGSMAEQLRGVHYELRCADCGFPFACGVENPPGDRLAVCPNCGYEQNRLDKRHLRPGDQVLIDRHAFEKRGPQRWDIVACRNPNDPDQLLVKRIVGLPGERVEIWRGDVLVDGRPVRKSLGQLRAMAIPVHDSSYRPAQSQTLPARWRPERADSLWRSVGTRFRWLADPGHTRPAPADTDDWLVYHHWPCMPSVGPRVVEQPVKDNYGYNQGLARQLHPVNDLMLRCWIVTNDCNRIGLRLHDGWQTNTIWLLFDRRQLGWRRGVAEPVFRPLADGLPAEQLTVELAVCDRQLMLAINARQVARWQLPMPATPPRHTMRPAAIAVWARSAELVRLQLLRDIHYLDPHGLGRRWSVAEPLGSGRYLLLGDNVPVSVDSRFWAEPGVERNCLVGKVLQVRSQAIQAGWPGRLQ